MNTTFLLAQIRLYNLSKNQRHQDVALIAIGIHAGLLDKRSLALRSPTNEERQRVIYFLRQFLMGQGIKVQIKDLLEAGGSASV